jgi:hypothetical protein
MEEIVCKVPHATIVEAIECARKNLGLTRETEHPRVGTKASKFLSNKDQIIGFTDSTGRKGWRVDWDPHKGCHVNEEDYYDKKAFRKVCHRFLMDSEQWTLLWWKKYTSAGLESYENQPVLKRADAAAEGY